MEDIGRISRVEFVTERTRTVDLAIREKRRKFRHPAIETEEDEFHLQPEPIPGGDESSGDDDLDIEG